MDILNTTVIEEFKRKHASARPALINWVAVVELARWTNDADLKATFNSADYVPGQGYVFNVGGNNIRLLAVVSFKTQALTVDWVKTHDEYSKDLNRNKKK